MAGEEDGSLGALADPHGGLSVEINGRPARMEGESDRYRFSATEYMIIFQIAFAPELILPQLGLSLVKEMRKEGGGFDLGECRKAILTEKRWP